MVIRARGKALWIAACTVLLGVVWGLARQGLPGRDASMVLGGRLCAPPGGLPAAVAASAEEDDSCSQRFQRPSSEPPLPNPYLFRDFHWEEGEPVPIFDDPKELLLAYYGILREASNMTGYAGGCGTVGESRLPYPMAYQLLTGEARDRLSLREYIDSFGGVGYTTLLRLLPAYIPAGTPDHVRYYMVELEVITGEKESAGETAKKGSRFAYYYGLAEVCRTPDQGWKLQEAAYIPENFLCAPVHGWSYWSDAVVGIVYGENMGLVDQIDSTAQTGCLVCIQASGKGGRYRFEFVRLTNGYDVLLREFVLDRGVWREADLLPEGWRGMKLTMEGLALRGAR